MANISWMTFGVRKNQITNYVLYMCCTHRFDDDNDLSIRCAIRQRVVAIATKTASAAMAGAGQTPNKTSRRTATAAREAAQSGLENPNEKQVRPERKNDEIKQRDKNSKRTGETPKNEWYDQHLLVLVLLP